MPKVSLQTAVKMTGKSESTLRRDIKKGKVSAERDDRGHLKFDVSELRRVYGELKTTGNDAESTAQANDKAMTGHDNPKVVLLLENQIADLKAQLESETDRENALITEKSKLLDMLSTEQEKTRLEQEKSRLLMLPASETNTAPERNPNWVQRLLGIQPS